MAINIFFQSKLLMFDVWYNRLLKIPGLKFDLGMTDTDSFLFKVNNENLLLSKINDIMDYSNYPPTHPNFSNEKKAKLGCFKDELGGTVRCKEFIGLRSKCYALKLEDKTGSKKFDKKVCKGIGRIAVQNRLRFQDYKKCLFQSKIVKKTFHSIRSQKHVLKTVLIQKRALSFTDTKRWLFECGIHSVPYGSRLIKIFNEVCPRCPFT